MTRLRGDRGRIAAALLFGGSVLMLAGCHTVGGTMSGMGQDIGQTGQFITGGGQKKPAPAGTPTPANQPATQAPPATQ